MFGTIVVLIIFWIYITHTKGDGGGPPTMN